MALADRYTKPDTRSRFEKWLDSLSKEHRKIIDGWLADTTISNIRISELIHDDDPEENFTGYAANKDTIAKYRRGMVRT